MVFSREIVLEQGFLFSPPMRGSSCFPDKILYELCCPLHIKKQKYSTIVEASSLLFQVESSNLRVAVAVADAVASEELLLLRRVAVAIAS